MDPRSPTLSVGHSPTFSVGHPPVCSPTVKRFTCPTFSVGQRNITTGIRTKGRKRNAGEIQTVGAYATDRARPRATGKMIMSEPEIETDVPLTPKARAAVETCRRLIREAEAKRKARETGQNAAQDATAARPGIPGTPRDVDQAREAHSAILVCKVDETGGQR